MAHAWAGFIDRRGLEAFEHVTDTSSEDPREQDLGRSGSFVALVCDSKRCFVYEHVFGMTDCRPLRRTLLY